MTKEMNRTRYLTLIGTIITQFALGSVYTWSLFNAQLSDKLDEPVSQVAFAFGLLSLSLAVASSMAGKLQERFGVRNVTLGAGVLLGIGFFLTAHASNLAMLYLCAGILVGFADGTGYLMTLSNCVKWFPERKGLISACSIGAYGLGSLGFKYINLLLLSSSGLETTFQLWGLIAMSMVLVGGMLMKDAPKQAASVQQSESRDFTLAEAMRKPQYWMLALMFLTACMSGLYVIGVAKDIGEKMVGLPAVVAANAVAIIAMANLGGRLVLGILSDKMSRIRVITIAQLITLAGMALLLVRAAQCQSVLRGGCLCGLQLWWHHHRLPLAGERLLRSQQPDQELRCHLSGLWSGQHHRLYRSLPVWRLYGDLPPDPGVAGGGAGALPHHPPACPLSIERA